MPVTRGRLPFMALAGVALLAALWGGLVRLGWPLPRAAGTLTLGHGPLLIGGFLGTLIGLERAVALRRRWAYGAPLCAGAGGLALILGLPPHLGHALLAAAGVGLVAVFVVLFRRQPSLALATMGLGAVLWLAGTVLWHQGALLYRVVPWWIGFLVLTIAGERLELSRLVRLPPWMRAGFLLATGLIVAGLVLGLSPLDAGIRVSGIGLLGLALWLGGGDIAWRTLDRGGAPRFTAVCLLSGHLWLAVGGLLWVLFADAFVAGARYDAMVHAILLGFVFSMIFGHAPIILPSVLGVALPFRRAFYAHWGLLHLSLLARILGDLAAWAPGQRWGGLGNALAIVLFMAQSARGVRS